MSRNSKPLFAKFFARFLKHQNLVIGFLLANAFCLGVGLLLGESLQSGKAADLFGSRYQKVTVSEIKASTSAKPVLGASQIGAQININTASLTELDSLPGIGPVYAQKIFSGRPYKAVLDLVTRKVLTVSVYNKIKDRIRVQ